MALHKGALQHQRVLGVAYVLWLFLLGICRVLVQICRSPIDSVDLLRTTSDYKGYW